MNKTLLIISGGIEAVPGIKLAKEMGLFVVVSDINPKAPGFSIADDRLIASTYNVAETVAAAKLYNSNVRKIDGVICIASDVPLTVASVAKELGLPGISIESALLATDKLKMKIKFRRDKVPIPWFSNVESCEHLKKVILEQIKITDRLSPSDKGGAFMKNKSLPLFVLKPIDSRGARGVIQITDKTICNFHKVTSIKTDKYAAISQCSENSLLNDFFELSKSYSTKGKVMVEQFLDGPQVSTESIVIDGMAYTVGFSDRNYEFLQKYSPHIIENGGELPSVLPQAQQQEVYELIQQAATSMGIVNGVVKGDIVVSGGKPYIIELAARLSGGYFCSHEIPLNTGVDFVGCAIRMALGKKIDPLELKAKFKRGVAQRYLFPEPGRVVDISGVDDVMSRSEVAFCEIRVKKGDIVAKTDSHPARAGLVITCCDTREEAIERAEAAVASIRIKTEPIL